MDKPKFQATSNIQPLVSIITIVYNGEEFLKGCFESIRNQTYKNIEYIVIDGGSSDDTLEICEQNKDIISILISEKDNGISDAFNKGIKLASGEIIGILNSDDLYAISAVEDVVTEYVNKGIKSCVFYGDICYFNDEVRYELVPEIKNIWKYMSIFHPAVFVCKTVYEEIGGFLEEFKYAMDVEFLHRALFYKTPFIYVNRTLTYFRLGGTSGVNYKGSYKEFYKSVKMYNSFPLARYYYYLGISKKMILATTFGKFLLKRRELINVLLSGKSKK